MSDFLPVLLGSDANVYGMARSFYQQYGVRSVAICKGALVATSNTNLVKIAVLEPDLENDETFVKTLTDYAKAHADKPLVLVSCADGYTVLMGRHRDALKPYYHFACPELQTVLDLDMKENFYRARRPALAHQGIPHSGQSPQRGFRLGRTGTDRKSVV